MSYKSYLFKFLKRRYIRAALSHLINLYKTCQEIFELINSFGDPQFFYHFINKVSKSNATKKKCIYENILAHSLEEKKSENNF